MRRWGKISDDRSSYANFIMKTAQRCIPICVLLELTYRCNQRCVHCYVVEHPEREELSFSQICNILDQLAKGKCLFLVLTGGEILTREDFFDIARYAKSKHFSLRLKTNGTLITPQVADRIAELSPLAVEISVYGAGASTHDAVTKIPGSFARTMNAIQLLKERGVRVGITTPLMKQNVKEYEQLLEMMKNLGVKYVMDPTITPKNDGSLAPTELRLNEDALCQIFSDPYLIKPWGKSVSVKEKVKEDICAAARRICCISPYGDVYPCIMLQISAGNLKEKSFHEIWWTSEVLSDIRSMKVADLSECTTCEQLPYCNPCVGLAFLEEGKVKGPSAMTCQIARVRERIARQKKTANGD